MVGWLVIGWLVDRSVGWSDRGRSVGLSQFFPKWIVDDLNVQSLTKQES